MHPIYPAGMTPAHNEGPVRYFFARAVLLCFVLLALRFVMSALFSAWMSGGPPNPYPLGWMRRAWAHMSFAGAVVFLGWGAFLTIRRFPSPGRLACALLLVGLLLVAAPYGGRFILIDWCLDEGGRWNAEAIQCDKDE